MSINCSNCSAFAVSPEHKEEDWKCHGWEDHERGQLLSGDALTFRERLEWLEQMDGFVERLESQRPWIDKDGVYNGKPAWRPSRRRRVTAGQPARSQASRAGGSGARSRLAGEVATCSVRRRAASFTGGPSLWIS